MLCSNDEKCCYKRTWQLSGMCSVVLFSHVTFSESRWSTVFDPQQSVEAIPGVAVFNRFYQNSGPWFNIKMSSCRYRKSHCGDKTAVRSSCLVHPCMRDTLRVSEIDLSQPRHETAYWWRHNRPVTSQLTNPIRLPNYTSGFMCIQNKESTTQRCRRSTNVQLCLIFLYISIWFES